MLVVTMGVALAAVLATATAAFATLPAGTTVTGTLKSGTKMTFKGDINSIPITVSCTTFSASGKVPSSPSYTVTLSSPPTISGCKDNTGGKDTITTNSTNGSWTISVSKKKPYKATLTVPKAGATFTSNILSGCVITAAPSAAAPVTGAYNGKNTDTVTNAKVPTSGSGCTSTTAKTSATVILSPSPGKPPF
jgi:hypothetical protein